MIKALSNLKSQICLLALCASASAAPQLVMVIHTPSANSGAVISGWAGVEQGALPGVTQASHAATTAIAFKQVPGADTVVITTKASYTALEHLANHVSGRYHPVVWDGVTYADGLQPLHVVLGVQTYGPMFGDSGGFFQSFAWYMKVGKHPAGYTDQAAYCRARFADVSEPGALVGFALRNDVALAGFYESGGGAPIEKTFGTLTVNYPQRALAGLKASGQTVWLLAPQVQPIAGSLEASRTLVAAMDAALDGKARWLVHYTPDQAGLREVMAGVVGEDSLVDVYPVSSDGVPAAGVLTVAEFQSLFGAYDGRPLAFQVGGDCRLVVDQLKGAP